MTAFDQQDGHCTTDDLLLRASTGAPLMSELLIDTLQAVATRLQPLP